MPLKIADIRYGSELNSYGVKPGDIITKINGFEVNSDDDVRKIYLVPGAEFEFLKGTETFTVPIASENPGLNVAGESGSLFTLFPQSSLRRKEALNEKPSLQLLGGQNRKMPENVIKFFAWLLFTINLLFLFIIFGSLNSIWGTFTRAEAISLLPSTLFFTLISIFLIAFAYLLEDYKNRLTGIEKVLIYIADKDFKPGI